MRYLPININSVNSLHILHSSYFRFCKKQKTISIETIYDCTYALYGESLSRPFHKAQKYFY